MTLVSIFDAGMIGFLPSLVFAVCVLWLGKAVIVTRSASAAGN